MFPLSDDNPRLRSPVVTHFLLIVLAVVWVFVQGAGVDEARLAASVCKFGLIAGEVTHRLAVGTTVPVAEGARCLVDSRPFNYLTLITSMFMHGSWMHILGNGWFLRIFGDNVEDCMGRFRFIVFYLLCGLAAAVAQIAIDPSSATPMIGASGAISGVMGAYVVFFPRVRVKTLLFLFIFIQIIRVPAWFMLLYWFGIQVFEALPQLRGGSSTSGVAVMAHVGGFVAGVVLAKLFANKQLLAARAQLVARAT